MARHLRHGPLPLCVLSVSLGGILIACGGWPPKIAADHQQPTRNEEKTTPVTPDQVRAALDPDEPDYLKAAQLGPGALSHLQVLIEEGAPELAPKAVYLASLIRDQQSAVLVQKAAKSDQAVIRVAAAAGARNLARPAATDVLLFLLNDKDGGVREVALQSVDPAVGSADSPPALRAKIEVLTTTDPEPHIRALAREVLRRLRRP